MAPDNGTDSINDEQLHSLLCKAYPDVDTTLILALLLDSDDRSSPAIETLTNNIGALSLQAKQDNACRRDEDEPSSSYCFSDSLYREDLMSGATSSTSVSLEPGVEFLVSAFPDIHVSILQRALDEAMSYKSDNEELDMETIMDEILTWEAIREMEERGLSGALSDGPAERDWTSVQKQKPGKKKRGRVVAHDKAAKTVVLADVRQQHRATPSRALSSRSSGSNPWTHLTSLSERLAELLPLHDSPYFLSLFHNPKFSDPADALLHELLRIGDNIKDPPTFDIHLVRLVHLLGCTDERDVQEARLCLRATSCEAERAFDLVGLLRDLENAPSLVLHSPTLSTSSTALQSPKSPSISAVSPRSPMSRLPSASPVVLSAPRPRSASYSQAASLAETPWTIVPKSRRRNKDDLVEVDPLGQFIPAYRNMPAGWRNVSGRQTAEPDLADSENVSEADCRFWAAHYKDKRDTALRDASRYWKRGNGDVASFYSEEARNHAQTSAKWGVRAAQALVDRRRSDRFTVDLHGLTVNEAIIVANDTVNEWWDSAPTGGSPIKPLTLITGKGTHSAGGIGVIGPAVKTSLESNGWSVSKRTGYLTVSGLQR